MNVEFRIGFWVILLLLLMAGCSEDEPQADYPTNGLVSYFSFDGHLEDAIGNAPTGIGYGNLVYLEGYRDQGVTFDGIDDYASIDRASYHSNNQYSVSFWFRSHPPAVPITMFHCQDFRFVINPGEVWHHAQTSSIEFSPSGPYLDWKWTHIVGVFDGFHSNIYVNGILHAAQYDNSPLIPGIQDLTVGLYEGEFWRGQLDELFIYDRPLRQTDVTHLYER